MFTNLPIRFRVLRHWLRNRYGEAYARLIFPLTEDHFRRFLKRAKLRAAEREAARMEALKERRALSNEAFENSFVAAHGADILEGPDANWILPTAAIVIDEGHHWFPMRDQREEDAALLGYLTMLRHHLHKLVIVSQNRMQVSITFRRLAGSFWHVRNRGEDKVAWGIKCRHLGITGFAYVRRTPDQEAGFKGDDIMASYAEQRVIWPWLPSERWKFRLYDSFTHIGSRRRMMAVARRLRQQLGLPEPETQVERAKRSVPEMLRSLAIVLILVALVSVSAVGGLWFGRNARPVEPPKVAAPLAGMKLQGVSKDAVSISGKRVPVGGVVGECVVVRADRKDRSVLLSYGGDFWVWRVGSERPTRLGPTREVFAAAADRYAKRLQGGRQPAGSGAASEAVGPPEHLLFERPDQSGGDSGGARP